MEYIKSGDKIVLRLERGEEIVSSLKKLQRAENIKGAFFSGIGATDNAVIGVYAVNDKKYNAVTLTGDMEIAALTGNISVSEDGGEYVHAHVVLGRGEIAHAGHLNAAIISATAEIFVFVTDIAVSRRADPETGLNVFEFQND